MPVVIKQKLQASRRSQVVNGTDFERTFYMFLSNSIQRGQKREKERKKEKGNAEKVYRLSGTSRIFLLGD